MRRAAIAVAAGGVVLALAAVAVGRARHRAPLRAAAPVAIAPPAAASSTPASGAAGFLYGRVTDVDGAVHEGRLRFGGGQEAFWDDEFNGMKRGNRWVALVPAAEREERIPIALFGIELGARTRERDVRRQLFVPFGEVARVEASGRDVRVTLRSGTAVELDRLEASDFDDGVRVWEAGGRVVDLDSLQVRAIDFLPTPALAGVPARLRGTARTRQGEFTGFVAWNEEGAVGSDELVGTAGGREVRVRLDAIRALERPGEGRVRATLADGRVLDLALAGEERRLRVDDPRYGRVRIDPGALERLELAADPGGGSGPGYDDFAPGRPLRGRVTTRDGRRLEGRLVYDLDESETADTLDGRAGAVHYTLSFARVEAIVPPAPGGGAGARARVTLAGGETLALERAGDLDDTNAGLLVFADGGARPDYLRWADVARIDLDPPPAPAGAPSRLVSPARDG